MSRKGETMKVTLSGTYGKTRDFKEVTKLPEIGDEWTGNGYEDAKVEDIINIDYQIAETTSGDPKVDHSFYEVSVKYDNDIFYEYVVIER